MGFFPQFIGAPSGGALHSAVKWAWGLQSEQLHHAWLLVAFVRCDSHHLNVCELRAQSTMDTMAGHSRMPWCACSSREAGTKLTSLWSCRFVGFVRGWNLNEIYRKYNGDWKCGFTSYWWGAFGWGVSPWRHHNMEVISAWLGWPFVQGIYWWLVDFTKLPSNV